MSCRGIVTNHSIKGFRKGTIAMVVVSVCLVVWICVVWWQDKRTAHIQVFDHVLDSKLEEIETSKDQAQDKDGH